MSHSMSLFLHPPPVTPLFHLVRDLPPFLLAPSHAGLQASNTLVRRSTLPSRISRSHWCWEEKTDDKWSCHISGGGDCVIMLDSKYITRRMLTGSWFFVSVKWSMALSLLLSSGLGNHVSEPPGRLTPQFLHHAYIPLQGK
jgi:hypothetical protein